MRNLLAVVSALVLMLAVVSTSLWRDLRSERQMNAAMQTQLTDARAASRMAARPSPVAAMPVSAPVPAATTTAAAKPDCKPAPSLPPAVAPVIDGDRVAVQALVVNERDLLKDPEYRKARLAQRRLDLQRSYPGVTEALGLSEKDAGKFFDLLAENQLRMNELPVLNISGGNAQAASQEMMRNRQALQQQQDEALAALLGTSGYAQWQDYQQTRGARSQAISMGSQLLQMGLPLTNAQLKPLTAAVVAEQQRQRQDVQSLAQNINVTDPQARAAAQEEAQRRSEESNRRLLAAIAPSLTPQQLAVFREQYETQEAMNHASSRARSRALAARGQ